MSAFIKAESRKVAKAVLPCMWKKYHITIIEEKETLNMHALDTAYFYEA